MKKKLPLDLIKGFNPKFGDSITFEKGMDNQRIVIFKDKDPDSDFYFEIKSFNSNNDKIVVEFKPKSGSVIKPANFTFSIEELSAHFKMWVNLIEEYNSSETIFDDPIVKGFRDEFSQGVNFSDPDSDVSPFPIDIILWLDSHLEKVETDVAKFKDSKNEKDIVEIKTLATDLRGELSKKSKKYVFSKLVNIWAKIAKQGPKLIKEFLTEGGKLIVKESVKYLLGKGTELL